MSFFIRRVWEAMLKPTRMVGRDLEGNRYYEMPIAGRTTRTSRSIRYKSDEDQYAYMSRQKNLPVQWTAWLSHTRPNPPTLEELQADFERQRRLQMKVAMIEAREQAERAQQELLPEPQSQSPSPPNAGEALPAHPITAQPTTPAQPAQPTTQSAQAASQSARAASQPAQAASQAASPASQAASPAPKSAHHAPPHNSQPPSPFDAHAAKPGSDQPEPWQPSASRTVRRGA
ncbi:hypothetical protein BD626DRAFT_494735 [Schizophyllum amplum]|uniref:NADH dehydrogenase [ubiquinone] 1 alpha subcomplex subunit n=1 Tax=Schizophyllum amplum TaxID=97359 RepID=A0A550CFL2_9AGAR|nr:hypothetical protein BD626DRAFT_494735 [Auriculariopsis ampla]